MAPKWNRHWLKTSPPLEVALELAVDVPVEAEDELVRDVDADADVPPSVDVDACPEVVAVTVEARDVAPELELAPGEASVALALEVPSPLSALLDATPLDLDAAPDEFESAFESAVEGPPQPTETRAREDAAAVATARL